MCKVIQLAFLVPKEKSDEANVQRNGLLNLDHEYMEVYCIILLLCMSGIFQN